jgi:hypothetical protein
MDCTIKAFTSSLTRVIAIVGVLIFASLVPMSIIGEETDPTWKVISVIPDARAVDSIVVNSAMDSLLIASGSGIEEWGIHNHTEFNYISLNNLNFVSMDWNDKYRFIAFAGHSWQPVTPSIWNSDLIILDYSGEPLDGLEPFGDLPSNNNTTVSALQWRPSYHHLAVGFGDGAIKIYDVVDKTVVFSMRVNSAVEYLSWNPDGSLLAALTHDVVNGTQSITFIDGDAGVSWNIPIFYNDVERLDWFYSGEQLLLLRPSSGILAYNMTSLSYEVVWDSFLVDFSPSKSGPTIALLEDFRISFLNLETDEIEVHVSTREPSHFAGWTIDGSYFYTMDELEVIRVWARSPLLSYPSIGIDNPREDSIISGSVTITGWVRSTQLEFSISIKVGYNDWVPIDGTTDWSYQLDTRLYTDGALMLRARALDSVGYTDVVTRRVFIENAGSSLNEKPIIAIHEPHNGTKVWGFFLFSGSAMDDDVITAIQYRIEGGLWNSIIIDGPSAEIEWSRYIEIHNVFGELRVYVRAFDGSLFSETESVYVNASPPDVDDINMSVEILFPSEGETVPSTFEVHGIVEGDEPDTVFIGMGHGPLVVAEGRSNWRYEFSSILNGPVFIRVVAKKDQTRSQYAVLNIFVDDGINLDNRPPIVRIERPEKGAILTDDFNVTGWSLDDVLIERVDFRVNNGTWMTASGTTEWSSQIQIYTYPSGWITVEIRAFDGELFSENDTRSYYIVHDDPVVTETSDLFFILAFILAISTLLLISILIRQRLSKNKQ